MATRQCPYCGKLLSDHVAECLYCHETLPTLPEIRVVSGRRPDGRGEIRKGLLYMLLAAVVHYFAGGYSAMQLPYPINPLLTVYLSPLLFLSGLVLSLHGFYLHRKV